MPDEVKVREVFSAQFGTGTGTGTRVSRLLRGREILEFSCYFSFIFHKIALHEFSSRKEPGTTC